MRPACLPGFCLDHLQCLRPGYLVCSRGHTAHRCALLQSPPREFIVFSMLEVTDNRLRARAPGVTGPDQSRRGSLGRVPPLLARAYPHQRRGPLRCPALLPPVGGSSSAETLTELPRSSGQGHAPSRSSQPRDRGRSFRLLPSAFCLLSRLPLTLPASSRPLFYCQPRSSPVLFVQRQG